MGRITKKLGWAASITEKVVFHPPALQTPEFRLRPPLSPHNTLALSLSRVSDPQTNTAMAMQSGIGVSKILILAGAGYTTTILFKNGKLSDLLAELQSLLNGSGEQSEGDVDAIASQVRRLAAEVRQLGSSRQITVLNGNGGNGNWTSLIMPAATLGAVGYGYMWWKGLSFLDLMYVTKRSMGAAVTNLNKHLETVTEAINKAKEHLSKRVDHLNDKMVEQKNLSKTIKDDVGKVQDSLNGLDNEVKWLQGMVYGLDTKMDGLEQKQDLANMGVAYLVSFVNGKKLELPRNRQKQLKDNVTRGRPKLMGLKEFGDDFASNL